MIYRCNPGDPEAGMIEADDGEYVEYEDYDRLREILSAFVVSEEDAFYDDEDGKAYCFYCGIPWTDGKIPHGNSCLFVAAREALQEDRDDSTERT